MIPVFQRAKTFHAFNRAATVFGSGVYMVSINTIHPINTPSNSHAHLNRDIFLLLWHIFASRKLKSLAAYQNNISCLGSGLLPGTPRWISVEYNTCFYGMTFL
jgi:hypothetical protein